MCVDIMLLFSCVVSHPWQPLYHNWGECELNLPRVFIFTSSYALALGWSCATRKCKAGLITSVKSKIYGGEHSVNPGAKSSSVSYVAMSFSTISKYLTVSHHCVLTLGAE